MSGYLGATLFTLLFGILVTHVGYSPMFVVLAVFDVLAAIVVWALIRDSGQRPQLNKSPACRGDHVSKESIR
jgi:ACS family hexuronate transporter-like MFS transporter